ncbi:hypothetical protein ACJMK2_036972 [Sinanodonta woodiana]|uniref:Uncharacterized protein n=1 Tax=Sinanodonta woodiana TaxID=1069815 RepID=A0ABD3WMB0_SINWO
MVSYGDKDDTKTLHLTSDDPKEIEQALLKIVRPKQDNTTKPLRVVDIYWPIPLLQIQFLLREIRIIKGLKMRDFRNVMFICNKWDQVHRQDVDSVWDNTWNNIEMVCGKLDKWQVIKFSSTLVQ